MGKCMKTDKSEMRWLGVVAVVALLALPGRAHAQCEVTGQPEAAAAAVGAAQTAAVTAATTATIAAIETTTSIARSAILTSMEAGWVIIQERLNRFYKEWHEAQKEQVSQLHAGQLDQTRQMGNINDAANTGNAARAMQTAAYNSNLRNVSTEEGCRFDTTAKHLSRATHVARAVAKGGARDVARVMGNKAGTPAAKGRQAMQAARIENYRNIYCDPSANGGKAGCNGAAADGSGGTAGSMPGAHIQPSKTLLGQETIDMSDPDMVKAINDLIFNISDIQVPDPVSPRVLATPAGKEQRLNDRELLTQMDTIASLAWSIVGERTPGEEAPEVQQMRLRMGVAGASDTPSEYELRQQVVEQLWDPAYYAGLQDGSAATVQKEIYLKAYSILQLNKLIEKMERISNIYVVQGANLIDKYDRSGDNADQVRRVRN